MSNNPRRGVIWRCFPGRWCFKVNHVPCKPRHHSGSFLASHQPGRHRPGFRDCFGSQSGATVPGCNPCQSLHCIFSEKTRSNHRLIFTLRVAYCGVEVLHSTLQPVGPYERLELGDVRLKFLDLGGSRLFVLRIWIGVPQILVDLD